MDPPGRHGVEGPDRHGEGVRPDGVVRTARPLRTAEGEVDQRRLGELGGAPEPAPGWVEPLGQFVDGGGEEVGDLTGAGVEQRGGTGPELDDRPGGDGGGQLVGLLLDLPPAVVPDVDQGVEHGGERRPAGQVPRREVGAAVERTAIGGEEDAHRPTAGAGHRLDGLHVDGVDVGPLLPVDLDRDEGRCQQAGHAGVLEGLVGHHVAPVAGRVADGQEDRLVLGGGLGERLLTPRVPVDRVVPVLFQVGGELTCGCVSDQGQGGGPSSSAGIVVTCPELNLRRRCRSPAGPSGQLTPARHCPPMHSRSPDHPDALR